MYEFQCKLVDRRLKLDAERNAPQRCNTVMKYTGIEIVSRLLGQVSRNQLVC